MDNEYRYGVTKLVSIDPVMIETPRMIHRYSKTDSYPYTYESLSGFIKKHNLQLGDDIIYCLWRSINKVYPVRPEPTEEQKATVKRGMFAS